MTWLLSDNLFCLVRLKNTGVAISQNKKSDEIGRKCKND